MVTHVHDNDITDRVTIRYLVRCVVEQSGAVRADQIARRISLDVETVREQLKYWVAKGLIEVIRPVSLENSHDVPARSDGEYYRWIRPSDTDYIWQTALMSQGSLPRLGNSHRMVF